MRILDLFRKKGVVAGRVVLHGLPPHKMFSASVSVFRVASATSRPPFGGNPPAHQLKDTVALKSDEEPEDKPLQFRLERSVGFYHLAVSVIAYIERDDKLLAWVERFFPMTQPCEINPEAEQQVELAVEWPNLALDQLSTYCTFHPRNTGTRDG